MGPLIDTELEKIDRKHMTIMELNQKLVDALQMYHSLMKMPPMAGGECIALFCRCLVVAKFITAK